MLELGEEVTYCKKRSIDKDVLVVDFKPAFWAAIGTCSLNERYAFCTIGVLAATDDGGCTGAGIEGVGADEAVEREFLLHALHDLTVALLLFGWWDILDWLLC